MQRRFPSPCHNSGTATQHIVQRAGPIISCASAYFVCALSAFSLFPAGCGSHGLVAQALGEECQEKGNGRHQLPRSSLPHHHWHSFHSILSFPLTTPCDQFSLFLSISAALSLFTANSIEIYLKLHKAT